MQLVQRITVTSENSGLLSFTNIPQTGKDLLLLASTRTNNGSVTSYLELQLNAYGDGARLLTGVANVASSSAAGYVLTGFTSAAGSLSNAFGNLSAYITDYTGSDMKQVSSDSVGADSTLNSRVDLSAGRKTTGAVTSLTLRVESDFFAVGTTAYLYIIT